MIPRTLGAGWRIRTSSATMGWIVTTTVKAEPVGGCVLSPYCYTIALLDDWAILQTMGADLQIEHLM